MSVEELKTRIAEAEKKLNDLVSEKSALIQEEQTIEARLKEIARRKIELTPLFVYSGKGLIARAQTDLTELRQELVDSSQPHFVIVQKYDRPDHIAVVLVKVTAKQVYLRQVGGDREFVVSKDGTKRPYGWEFDLKELLKFAGVGAEG